MLISGTPSRPAKPLPAPGEYFTPEPLVIGTHANTSLNADRLYGMPFVVPSQVTLDQLAIYVQAAVASSHAMLGLYALDGATSRPGALLVTGAEVDTGTTGTKTAGITITLNPGIYVASLRTSGAITVRSYSTVQASPWGLAVLDGSTAHRSSLTRALAYDASLPDPFGSIDGFGTNTPLILPRRAA